MAKSSNIRVCLLDVLIIKLSETLIIDKTPSKLVLCDTKIHFYPKHFVRKPFEKSLPRHSYTESNLYILNIFVINIQEDTKLLTHA